MAAAGAEPSHLLLHTVEYYYPHVIPATLYIDLYCCTLSYQHLYVVCSYDEVFTH